MSGGPERRRKFQCDQCGETFKHNGSLKYHSNVHTGVYTFMCDICGNGYMKHDMMIDCKNTHAGIFKFHCTRCEYRTNKTNSYKKHITIHSSEKPFICPLCDHQSSTSTNLGGHIKKVHKITLCQAEKLAGKTRLGENMTEGDFEQNKTMLERGKKIFVSTKMRLESQKGKDRSAVSDPQSLKLLEVTNQECVELITDVPRIGVKSVAAVPKGGKDLEGGKVKKVKTLSLTCDSDNLAEPLAIHSLEDSVDSGEEFGTKICEVCGLVLAVDETLDEHLVSRHLTLEGLCDICGEDSDDFIKHFFDIHLVEEEPLDVDENQNL